jgi:hypothetical protein
MHWLITVRADADLRRVVSRLKDLGCSADEEPIPIPLDEGEQVIEVEGPQELPRLAVGEKDIVKVSPSSKLTLY